MSDRERRVCPDCGVHTSNDDHTCIEYDGPPCEECGAGTTVCHIAAPGYGMVRVCANNHSVDLGPTGILSVEDVI